MKIVGFILTRNNSKLFLKTLNRIPNTIDKIFVSDDQSQDNIKKICKHHNVKVYKNKSEKRGYGSNLKNALDVAFKIYKADYAVEIHGDGAQFNPIATNDVIKLLKKRKLDLIVGSRILILYENFKLGYPFSRMIPNIIISFIERYLLKINITDFHSGFRVYSKNLAQKLSYKNFSNDYLFSFQIILYSKKNNLKIGEVPVKCDYKGDHTSHKLFGKNSAFTYQLSTFKLIYKYLVNKLNY